jgi:hypothetical protein
MPIEAIETFVTRRCRDLSRMDPRRELETVARHRRLTRDPASSTAEQEALEAPRLNGREQTADVGRALRQTSRTRPAVADPPAGSCSGGEHRTDADHPKNLHLLVARY